MHSKYFYFFSVCHKNELFYYLSIVLLISFISTVIKCFTAKNTFEKYVDLFLLFYVELDLLFIIKLSSKRFRIN